MLACDETMTLVRHIREDDGDRYECTAIRGGSWYRKTSIALNGDGAKPVGTCSVRFPPEALDGAGPKVGDYLVRGGCPPSSVPRRTSAGWIISG